MSDGVTVDASAPLTFGGNVKTVLESPRAVMPPKTLEEARNQPGRREQIEAITKQHRGARASSTSSSSRSRSRAA